MEHLKPIPRKVVKVLDISKGRGRPSVVTEEVIRKLEEAFMLDLTVLEACFLADIGKTAYYDWLGENPEYADRFESLRQNPIIEMKKAVITFGKENYSYAMDYLKRRRPNEFGDKTTQEVKLSGRVDSGHVPDTQVVNEIEKKITDEYHEKLRTAIALSNGKPPIV